VKSLGGRMETSRIGFFDYHASGVIDGPHGPIRLKFRLNDNRKRSQFIIEWSAPPGLNWLARPRKFYDILTLPFDPPWILDLDPELDDIRVLSHDSRPVRVLFSNQPAKQALQHFFHYRFSELRGEPGQIVALKYNYKSSDLDPQLVSQHLEALRQLSGTEKII
jgi:hypothetical protein